MNIFFNKKKNKGFTLIEMLVATSLFIVVVSSVSAIFIRALRAQRAITTFAAVNENLSQSIEQMAREIRTGTGFEFGDGGTNTSKLKFTSAIAGDVEYGLIIGGNCKKTQICKNENLGPGPKFNPITSNGIVIEKLDFSASQIGSIPNLITFTISARPASERFKDSFTVNLQTTISPRVQGK